MDVTTLADATNSLIAGSAYRISRFPLGRTQPVSTSPKRLHLCQQFPSQPISSPSHKKRRLPVYSHDLYKEFLNTKASSLKCRRCHRVSCKCSHPGNACFAAAMAQRSRRRSALIEEIKEEIGIRSRLKAGLRLDGRCSARDWRGELD